MSTIDGAARGLLLAALCLSAAACADASRCTSACDAGVHDDVPSDINRDAADVTSALDADATTLADSGRCARSDQCDPGQVCSQGACVAAGFGFDASYRDGGDGGAPSAFDGAAAEWPVVNGSERRERRTEVPGALGHAVARWRFGTGQALTATQVAFVDLDGDGAPEVITVEGSRVRARHEDGSEVWRSATIAPSLTIASAADLDGDGSPEITLTADPPGLVVLRGRTGELAASVTDMPVGVAQTHVVPDLSGDGHPDVLVCSKNLDAPQTLSIRTWSFSTSGLTPLWSYSEPNAYYGMPVVVAGDVDGDPSTTELTIREYWSGWFKTFDHAGHVVIDSGRLPSGGGGLYLRDVDHDPSTPELLTVMDRNSVATDAHEIGLYHRDALGAAPAWTNVWRQYDTDAPPSSPVLLTPWFDAVEDFDGDGHLEVLVGINDEDPSAGRRRWSLRMHDAASGRLLGSTPDLVPRAVVHLGSHSPLEVLAVTTPDAVVPPLGTTSLLRWNGSAFATVWMRSDAAPAPIRTRVDVTGPTGYIDTTYSAPNGVADLDGDGTPEVLLFARGDDSEFGDRPGQLLAVAADSGRTVATYTLNNQDVVEPLFVQGSGDTLRVWLSSRQLGIIALDRRFNVVQRLAGAGFAPSALVVATSAGPRLIVRDSSDRTHVLRADPASADLLETAQLNYRVFVLGASRGPSGALRLFAQDRNGDQNLFRALDQQPDGSLVPAWSRALPDSETVEAVSRGSFGTPPAPGYLLQTSDAVMVSSGRYLAMRESDGVLLWQRSSPPPRPGLHASLLTSAVVSCGGGDHVLSCAQDCACALIAGSDGSSSAVPDTGGCSAISAAAGRTDAAGDTPVVLGGGAYTTGLVTVHNDCSFGTPVRLPAALQTVAALVRANDDAVLDAAYWSTAGCVHVVDGATSTTLWSRSFFGGTSAACDPSSRGERFAPTPVVAGDVDGDGSEDLVVGTGDGDLLAVTASAGDTVFRVATGQRLAAPALADVDGDGRPEVVVGADDGYLYVFAAAAR